MNNVYLISIWVFALALIGCKTDAERRTECEQEADRLASEFIKDSISNEDKQLLKNINDLIKANAIKSECKELKHTIGGNDPEAINYLIKDYVNISEVENDDRYEQYENKESDAIIYLGYYNTRLSDFGDVSFYLNKDSVADYLKNNIYDGEEIEQFTESSRNRLSYVILEGRSRLVHGYEVPALGKLRKYEYIGFVEGEYKYPPIITKSGEFEGGVACVHLKIFRIKGKSLILDKRIFATSSSELEGGYTVDLVDEYGNKITHTDTSDESRIANDLADRLRLEIVLQAIKAGVPYKDKSEIK